MIKYGLSIYSLPSSARLLWTKSHGWYILFVNTSVLLFSHPVVFDSLLLHGLQHARPPCPSPFPEVYPSSCPLHRWCHPTISSSVNPLSSCPQSFQASGSFQVSWLFTSGGQSIGASAPASILLVSIQGLKDVCKFFTLKIYLLFIWLCQVLLMACGI